MKGWLLGVVCPTGMVTSRSLYVWLSFCSCENMKFEALIFFMTNRLSRGFNMIIVSSQPEKDLLFLIHDTIFNCFIHHSLYIKLNVRVPV